MATSPPEPDEDDPLEFFTDSYAGPKLLAFNMMHSGVHHRKGLSEAILFLHS